MNDLSQAGLLARLPQDPVPLRQERVQVYVTRDVAFNLAKMNELTKNVLGKLGCDECHSGRLIDFLLVEKFVVNPKTLQVDELIPGPQIRG